MTEPPAKPAAAATLGGRVSWPQLVAYGAGGIIPIALFNIAGQLMALLGNISLGLSAIWLGAILMVPRLWDAVSDPVMGHISDNTRTRWGRRRPYLLFGAIAVAVSFAAMWWVPRGEAIQSWFSSETAYNWFQLSFILGTLLIFYTACTVFEIPHGALGMEMSTNYHERTRLFSAKSFLGNFFAMGTPWLIAVASLEIFSGPGGDLIDGMRFVSLAIAAVLIPMACWWFAILREPGFAVARQQERTPFWSDMRTTVSNGVFVRLIFIVFTLAMGFNLVNIFGYYIKIFYLYGGDVTDAAFLLGIDGTVWAVTGLVAVFPLNWLSERMGKAATLRIAILLMTSSQILKIVCYNPMYPYLVLLPTMLLSAGMLMFFTLGSSMVGDICDLDELQTGTRTEGSYYSVFWWFIKMGTAVASLAMGILLVYTNFDEKQNVSADKVVSSVEAIKQHAETWQKEAPSEQDRAEMIQKQLQQAERGLEKLRDYFGELEQQPIGENEHIKNLITGLDTVNSSVEKLQSRQSELIAKPTELQKVAEALLHETALIKQQSPTVLFRLRAVEIGLPLALCAVSLCLTLGYPLTEARSYEISAELEKRRAEREE